MFLSCTIAPAGAYQWNRPGRQRINQLQRICMAYDQVRAQAHAFLSHIKRSVDNLRQFAFIWKRLNRKFWNILYLDTPLFFTIHPFIYNLERNIMFRAMYFQRNPRQWHRGGDSRGIPRVRQGGPLDISITYLSTIYREGHGFITVPDITHVLQTLGEKLAPDETQVQLLRRMRRYCYTSQPN